MSKDQAPNDIRLLADLLARSHEERQFAVGGQTQEALADDIAKALLLERERCAALIDQWGETAPFNALASAMRSVDLIGSQIVEEAWRAFDDWALSLSSCAA